MNYFMLYYNTCISKKRIFHRILKNSQERLTKTLETRQKVQEYRTDIITARRKQLTIFHNNAYCTQEYPGIYWDHNLSDISGTGLFWFTR